MILRLCLNQMVLQSSEHELSLRQRQPDGPGRILVNRCAAANLVNADGPIRPGHLHHDPPLLLATAGPGRAGLVGLDAEQLRFSATAVELALHAADPDEDGAQCVILPCGAALGTCPVQALRKWLQTSDTRFEPVFRKIDCGAPPSVTASAPTRSASQILARWTPRRVPRTRKTAG